MMSSLPVANEHEHAHARTKRYRQSHKHSRTICIYMTGYSLSRRHRHLTLCSHRSFKCLQSLIGNVVLDAVALANDLTFQSQRDPRSVRTYYSFSVSLVHMARSSSLTSYKHRPFPAVRRTVMLATRVVGRSSPALKERLTGRK